MKKLLFVSLIVVCAGIFHPAFAAKLVEVRQVDKDYLMVYIKDGEVVYRDNGIGASAYTGHDYSEGDDRLIAFGKELDTDQAVLPANWTITSEDDPEYAKGLRPLVVHRKSKVNNTNEQWEYKLDHWLFLKLPSSMRQAASYTIHIDPSTNLDTTESQYTFNVFNTVSEAVHVNLIGYTPDSPVKSADLYLWLGDGGPRDYKEFEGNTVWLLNTDTGERTVTGQVTFWKESATEAENRNLTGSSVWNADFDAFNTPGKYRLVIDGVGSSPEFEIKPDLFFQPFRYSLRGYYYMRIGEDHMEMVPVPRRPTFIPGKDPKGFTVYITDLDPFDKEWRERRGDNWDECHFKPAAESMFWKHRLPGNPTNPNAYGGHSDALDWDRHLSHVSNIYDILLPYFLSNGKLNEDNLDIAESGNGIPDLIDEARNEVDLFLRLRYNGGYSQGLTNPTQERTFMFQAGNTTMAAWANAANAAMIADCFRIDGKPELAEYYRDQAIEAFDYAGKQENLQLDDGQEVGKHVRMRGRDFKMMAAAFLYNVTGDRKWEDMMAEESVARDKNADIENLRHWIQTWGTAAYLFTPRERHYPELYENMKQAIIRQALANNVKYMDVRPSRRSSNNNLWQTSEEMDMVILAHALSHDEQVKNKLERSMVLEVDWGLGRNPSNMVEMTGLGSRHVVNCYTAGRNDGTPGLHPGHTPYHNMGVWGTAHEGGGNPRWFSDKGYPDWDKGGWPYQEAHFNCRYSWANAEFTPRETMRGKMAVYGYLYFLSKQ